MSGLWRLLQYGWHNAAGSVLASPRICIKLRIHAHLTRHQQSSRAESASLFSRHYVNICGESFASRHSQAYPLSFKVCHRWTWSRVSILGLLLIECENLKIISATTFCLWTGACLCFKRLMSAPRHREEGDYSRDSRFIGVWIKEPGHLLERCSVAEKWQSFLGNVLRVDTDQPCSSSAYGLWPSGNGAGGQQRIGQRWRFNLNGVGVGNDETATVHQPAKWQIPWPSGVSARSPVPRGRSVGRSRRNRRDRTTKEHGEPGEEAGRAREDSG